MIDELASAIIVGALYALAGLGLVAAYRATRVLNFALGGIGAVSTYAAYSMLNHGLPYVVVFPVALVIGGLLGAVTELVVVRPLRARPPITIALGTLGALLILQGALGAIYGYGTDSLPELFANAPDVHIGSLDLSFNQFVILGVTLVATAALALVVMRSRLGLGMRAMSSGPVTAELMGVNGSTTRLISWAIGGLFGGLAAMLVTPTSFLTPTSFTTFLLTAFAAVVLGGFTSLSGVVIGAIVFGVAMTFANTYLAAGLNETYTFIGLALVLVLRPHGIFGRAEKDVVEPRLTTRVALPRQAMTSATDRTGRRTVPMTTALTVLLVFVLIPFVLGAVSVYLVTTLVAMFIAVLGLNVMVGYAGQVSLGQAGFLTLGGYTAAIMQAHTGQSSYVEIVVAVLVGAIAGLIIGIPAARLSGIYLAVLTLAFTFAVPEVIQQIGNFTGGANGLPVAMPSAFTSPRAGYWFVAVIAGIVSAAVLVASKSRVGREWRAVRDSEPGARSLGANPTYVRLGAFVICSALAALSGALLVMLAGFISPQSFDVFDSVYILLAVVLGGSGSVLGSLIGAAFITLVPNYLPTQIPPDIVYGVVVIVILIAAPSGFVGLLDSSVKFLRARLRPNPSEPDVTPVALADPDIRSHSAVLSARAPATPSASQDVLLELRDVSAGYGPISVLRNISVNVCRGEIVALVGANGAGKTTLLRTISQMVRHSSGTIIWDGRELGTGGLVSPHAVTRAGLSHVPEGRGIFPDLTVSENLTLGTFGAPRDARVEDDAWTRERIYEHFPRLRERLGQRAGTLSGGEQQMLAIGRALLAQPTLLAVDEPSLGLAPVIAQEVFAMMEFIAQSGVSILIVEQNVDAALSLAARCYVMSSGGVVIGGTASELRDDDRVSEIFLASGA